MDINTGKRIILLRKEKNLTQEELADIIPCSRKAISRYEKNHSLVETYILIRLSIFFDVSTDYLLGLSKEKNNIGGEDYKMNLQEIVCKSKLNIFFENEDYYWITKSEFSIGGQTCFIGFTEDKKEIRTLREVNPRKAIEMCSKTYGTPLIVNTPEEASAFNVVGGNAIVLKSICKEYLPEFLVPFVVE
ncbi:helix-turn-helix domain-containing protein [Clostridium estertheticum]|uniref:helix-turn-helix domain-containing protein n=1 Tax=Clostridium estertheticum TaxID=238834 RepID=UPI001C0D0484|nr:helix-turn-helix transcriptional regulator [Clostridium estertheticum]MBU3200313.1 helix-turn-helix domain-containing protein [Clostridium estertheticum]WAG64482.1 helix-turn-helix domain-containing protein [Clostridium estertheticum]